MSAGTAQMEQACVIAGLFHFLVGNEQSIESV